MNRFCADMCAGKSIQVSAKVRVITGFKTDHVTRRLPKADGVGGAFVWD